MQWLLNLIPAPYRFAVGGLGVLVVVGAAIAALAQADTRGYHRATLEWTIKYQQLIDDIDKQRTAEINRENRVNAAAKAAEEADLEALRSQLAAAQILNFQLADEASLDPGHDNIAFDAAAVDRHIRRNQ